MNIYQIIREKVEANKEWTQMATIDKIIKNHDSNETISKQMFEVYPIVENINTRKDLNKLSGLDRHIVDDFLSFIDETKQYLMEQMNLSRAASPSFKRKHLNVVKECYLGPTVNNSTIKNKFEVFIDKMFKNYELDFIGNDVFNGAEFDLEQGFEDDHDWPKNINWEEDATGELEFLVLAADSDYDFSYMGGDFTY